MILVSFLPLWCAIMHALDYMFVGAVGEIFVIIISSILMCTWCCTFFVSTADVEERYPQTDEEGNVAEQVRRPSQPEQVVDNAQSQIEERGIEERR